VPLEGNRGLGHWEPYTPLVGCTGSAGKGPTLLQRFEALRAEVCHAMTVNSVTGMPNGFAEAEVIRNKLSGIVVALSEQASELAALRREAEILRGRTHLVPTSEKTGRRVYPSSVGSLSGLETGSLGVQEQERSASTTLLIKPRNGSLGKKVGSLDSLLDPVSQGLQLDKVRKTKDATITTYEKCGPNSPDLQTPNVSL